MFSSVWRSIGWWVVVGSCGKEISQVSQFKPPSTTNRQLPTTNRSKGADAIFHLARKRGVVVTAEVERRPERHSHTPRTHERRTDRHQPVDVLNPDRDHWNVETGGDHADPAAERLHAPGRR